MLRLLPKTSLGNVALGIAVAVVGPAIVRPVLVGLVRAGYDVKDYATSAWDSAKSEARTIRDEAQAKPSAEVESEIAQLRAEIAQLKKAKA
ncbi:MAG: hypothetical protein KAY59_10880 [Acidobacteria bacterium]|jgi:hypothetical protein|nr:hypothetical protein [Acidobacteriota bacterium]